MKSRKLFMGIGAVFAVVAVVLGITFSGLGPSWLGQEARGVTGITVEEAMDSVRQFENAGLPDLELIRMVDSPLHSRIELKSGNTTYTVNAETGAVEMAFYGDNFHGMEVVLSMNEAGAVASGFAERHYPTFADLTLDESTLLDHGSGGKEYWFAWVELLDGVRTPNKIFLSVDPATGKVVTYIAKHQIIEPFGSPSVSQEEARRIAEDAYSQQTGVKVLTVGQPVLEIVLINGKQHLAWRVEVAEPVTSDGIETRAQRFVDAHSGAVLQAGF